MMTQTALVSVVVIAAEKSMNTSWVVPTHLLGIVIDVS